MRWLDKPSGTQQWCSAARSPTGSMMRLASTEHGGGMLLQRCNCATAGVRRSECLRATPQRAQSTCQHFTHCSRCCVWADPQGARLAPVQPVCGSAPEAFDTAHSKQLELAVAWPLSMHVQWVTRTCSATSTNWGLLRKQQTPGRSQISMLGSLNPQLPAASETRRPHRAEARSCLLPVLCRNGTAGAYCAFASLAQELR